MWLFYEYNKARTFMFRLLAIFTLSFATTVWANFPSDQQPLFSLIKKHRIGNFTSQVNYDALNIGREKDDPVDTLGLCNEASGVLNKHQSRLIMLEPY
jgi:hypothetical protein